MERLSPILMTALGAGVGLIPLALGAGEPGRKIHKIIRANRSWPRGLDCVNFGLRVELRETEFQQRVKQTGGKWNFTERVREIQYDRVVALGLKKRIVRRLYAP